MPPASFGSHFQPSASSMSVVSVNLLKSSSCVLVGAPSAAKAAVGSREIAVITASKTASSLVLFLHIMMIASLLFI